MTHDTFNTQAIEITVPLEIPSWNRVKDYHYRTYQKERDKWKQAVQLIVSQLPRSERDFLTSITPALNSALTRSGTRELSQTMTPEQFQKLFTGKSKAKNRRQ